MTLSRFDGLVTGRLPEKSELLVGQPSTIPRKTLRLLELQCRPRSVASRLRPASTSSTLSNVLGAQRHVALSVVLHHLPTLGPKPGLVGAMRQKRVQFDHPLGSLDDVDLRARLVEAIVTTHIGRHIGRECD